jgi:hypothetical protein
MNNKEAYTAFRIFINRDDSYAVMKEGENEYFVVKDYITPDILRKHLEGEITVGIFQLSKSNKVKWICWDFDTNDKTLEMIFEDAKKLYKFLKEKGYNPILEFSGHKGYHIWLFFNLTNAKNAKLFAEKIANESKSNPHEIFPKQTELSNKGYGSMVKLPLGLHRVSRKYSFLFDEAFNELKKEDGLNLLIKHKIDKIPEVESTLKP